MLDLDNLLGTIEHGIGGSRYKRHDRGDGSSRSHTTGAIACARLRGVLRAGARTVHIREQSLADGRPEPVKKSHDFSLLSLTMANLGGVRECIFHTLSDMARNFWAKSFEVQELATRP